VEKYVLKTDPSKYIYEPDSSDVDLTKYTPSGSYWEFDYCTKITVTTYYHYYKWSEWSDWSDTAVTAGNNREIETRYVYTISYDANGGENTPAQQRKLADETIVLDERIPTKSGFIFEGWSTIKDGAVEYLPGEKYVANSSLTLYAVWKYNSAFVVKTPPNKTEYLVGESLDTTGMVLQLINTDGTVQQITDGYTVSGFDSAAIGKKTVTVSYGAFSTVFTVTVLAKGTCGGELIWRLDEEGTLTVSGTGAMVNYSSIKDVPWYNHRDNIKAVVIEPGVTRIGAYAFYGLSNMVRTVIPGTVTTIGNRAFQDCAGLKNAAIPEGVLTIGQYAFDGCSGLSSITFGNSITSIGYGALQNCTGLTTLVIPNSVTSIGNYAFKNCAGLTDVIVGNGITSIGAGLFAGCGSIENLTIPFVGDDTDTSYYARKYPLGYIFGTSSYAGGIATEQYEYYSSSSAKSTYYIPESLKSVTVTSGSIYDGAFYNCKNLSEIILGNDVTFIGTNAFYHCENLTSITIGRGVSAIQSDAFSYCISLKNLYINSITAWCGINFADSSANPLSRAEYLYLNNKLATDIVIPDGVTRIRKYAFCNYGNLASITIPESMTQIDESAFSGCSDLTAVRYNGTADQWSAITVGSKNEPLLNAKLHCRDAETIDIVYAEDNVQELLNTVDAGKTVVLTKDVTLNNVSVWENVTLDLNGYSLSADYFTCYGAVTDGTDGGNALVVVNKGIHLATENEFLPVYDSTSGGYRFYKYALQNLGYKVVDSDTIKVGFRLTFSNASGYDVLSTTTDAALDTVALLSWSGSAGVTHYTFKDDTMRSYASLAAADIASKGSTSKALSLTLTGVSSLGKKSEVNFQPTVETNTGTTALGVASTWTTQ